MKRSTYDGRDYAFGQAMLTLRTNIGLTQAGLAERLGVSRRAVGEWEAGSAYPKAERLKLLIALGIQQQAFAAGHEAEEIHALWKAAHQKLLLDELWLAELLSQQHPPPLFAMPQPIEQTIARDQAVVQSARGLRVVPIDAHNGAGRYTTTAQPLLDIPFVGRGAEVSRLMRLYEQASSGQPQVVLLEGEAGIGKTRLAAAFLDWVKAQGAEVLEGRAFQTSQRLSYQPLIEALRTRLAQEHDLRQLMSDPWLAELSRLLPDLLERYPNLPPLTINGPFALSRLFEALARLSRALASQAPLLIFADDMQWVDGATLDVFQYLARHWTEHKTPTMLLLSRRTETREMDPEMSEWLASLRNSIALTRLEPGPLSANDTTQIVRELAGGDAAQASLQGERPRQQSSPQHVQVPGSGISSERFGAWLFAKTHGQPFYLRALLQELLERGVLVPRLIVGSGWVFEPCPSLLEATPSYNILTSEVREMILRRLARLSSPARDFLAAGAILGYDFTFEELCQVAQLAPQDGLAALDEALQSLLLRESSYRGEGRREVSYHFADDKIRDVVYSAAGDARRRVFHSRVYGPGVHGNSPRRAGLEIVPGAESLS